MHRRHAPWLALAASAALVHCSRSHDEHDAAEAHTPPSSELTSDQRSVVERPDGKQATHVGEPFVTAPQVTLAELLAAPQRYVGQTIEVEGDVAAMCHHRRAWLALVGDDQSGRNLQVWTVPVFLVPDGAIGKRAVAQGSVEVLEVSGAQERHMASEHQLEAPAPEAVVIKKVVLRARAIELF